MSIGDKVRSDKMVKEFHKLVNKGAAISMKNLKAINRDSDAILFASNALHIGGNTPVKDRLRRKLMERKKQNE